jgi:lipoprotein-anchoring transpeptidase ErfK/SrfK
MTLPWQDPIILDVFIPPVHKPVPIKIGEEVYTGPFYPFTLTSSSPVSQLEKLVGKDNIATVLTLNHIDSKFLKQNSTVVVPRNFNDPSIFQSFPATIPSLQNVPKMVLISQRVQYFGVYEYGNLVRSGAVSTGKQSTPTPSKLYFTNWKGKEVHSSFDDEWVLKWNFNLDNHEGIGMHQYEMPGYPASHSCIRMFEADAVWIYDWADQWILTPNQQNILVHGTPVLIFGSYDFGKQAPWKNLTKDENALKTSNEEIEKALNPAMVEIEKVLMERSSI